MIAAEKDNNRAKRTDRKVLAAGEMPDFMLDAITRTEMDPRHRPLDELLKDWTP